jgi:hypothetical protein
MYLGKIVALSNTEPPVYRDLGDEHFVSCHFAESLDLRPAFS